MSLARPTKAAPRLWLRVIGPMQVTDATGASFLPRSRKARAIIALLALAAPRPVSRVRITSLLWSQRDREQARGSLRQCVHEIQGLFQALGSGLFEADREHLRLADDAFWIDVRDASEANQGVLLEDLFGLDPAFDEWIRTEQYRTAQPAALPSKQGGPRVGVRHLRALGGAAEATLAEALGEEIAVALSRFRWMSAIAPGALAQGPTEGDVEYLLDGAIRRIGNQIRIALRVQDMRAAGEVLWARNFDGTEDDLLSFNDRVVHQAASQVDPELLLREGIWATDRITRGEVTASALTQASVPALFRLDRDDFAGAGRMLEEAVRLAPESSTAHAWFAHWHVLAIGQGWQPNAPEAIRRAEHLAERAIMLDPGDARSLTIAGHVRGFLGKRVDEALVLHDRALALNPALSWAWMMSGLAYAYRGDHAEAIRRIETARRLSPFDPQAFFFDVSLMLPHLMLGNFERATELGRLTAQIKPSFSSSWKGLLVALGHLGRFGEAAEVCARLVALEPGFSIGTALERSPLQRDEDRARFAEGMRLGGLQK